jgi:hypothetical protein
MSASGTNKKITLSQFQAAPLSAGTANGVAYLNGSKVLTTGSALIFDGTNLGIGASPNARLTIKSSPADNIALRVLPSTGGVGSIQFTDDPVTTARGSLDASSTLLSLNAPSTLAFTTSSAERMRIDNGGNVGIGTTSISGGGGGTILNLSGATAASFRVSNSISGDALDAFITGGIGYLQTATAIPLVFRTNTTERMRIDASGNLIQSAPTTPPSLATNGQMVFNLTSNTNLRVSVRGSDGVTRTANITLA